jgi:hypothetical protein
MRMSEVERRQAKPSASKWSWVGLGQAAATQSISSGAGLCARSTDTYIYAIQNWHFNGLSPPLYQSAIFRYVCTRLGPFEITSNGCSTQPPELPTIRRSQPGALQLSHPGMTSKASHQCIVLTKKGRKAKSLCVFRKLPNGPLAEQKYQSEMCKSALTKGRRTRTTRLYVTECRRIS